MTPVFELYANEDDYPELDAAGAAARLSRAVRFKTVNAPDPAQTDFSQFDGLQAHMRESYPHVFAFGRFETAGHSVLITLPGRNPALRPCLFMAHQDVVPVVAGTEDDWTYPAFSGAIAEGYIWGRGTLDIKNQLFAALEAAEYLLAQGKIPERTVYLAFGEDEETRNTGAKALSDLLKARGVTLEFVLDEGGGRVEPGDAYGAPGVFVTAIDLSEKGYADLRLSVKSAGGHSSRPFGGTSLGRLSRAIARITEIPFPVRLPDALAGAFEALAPAVTEEPLKTLLRDIPGNADAIARYCRGRRELFPFVGTTAAPTMITGGSAACNVMPQDMEAVVNFRIAAGETAGEVLARCRAAAADPEVDMTFLQANDPSASARRDGPGYALLAAALKHYFPRVTVIPGMTAGATDARRYEQVCDTCLRCSPFMTDPEDVRRGVHGTDERLPLRAYAQGIRVLLRVMETAAFTA